MNKRRFHHQLLDTIESELAGVGCIVTAAKRERLARLFDLMDQVTTCNESQVLCVEIGRELHSVESLRHESNVDDSEYMIQPPEYWLDQAECA